MKNTQNKEKLQELRRELYRVRIQLSNIQESLGDIGEVDLAIKLKEAKINLSEEVEIKLPMWY